MTRINYKKLSDMLWKDLRDYEASHEELVAYYEREIKKLKKPKKIMLKAWSQGLENID